MGRAKDANGNLAAIGDHQLAKRGHRTTPTGMWNVESKGSDSNATNDFSIPHSAFLHVSASTGFSSIPIGTIVARTRSPGLRNVPVAEPTPDGVPVAMMSPGSSVTN